ncbi:MAG: NAD(P)-dependent oxidoreductase [Desulfobulbaceae bacterium]|nr:MAG: NAD(P)-dependent oxidoreductase [Desulfobulbaceae bacterium]
MKKALVLGASGATGQILVTLLIQKGFKVLALVRKTSIEKAPFAAHDNLELIEAEISTISIDSLAQYTHQCEVVCCCLGHNISFRGILGPPWRLVADAVQKVSRAIEQKDAHSKTKFILMNTSGCTNPDIPETPPLSQRLITSILRVFLPPLVDNEKAVEFLRLTIGQKHEKIEWVAVRPDDLINETHVSDYEIHASPIRNVIFDAGKTSRINVADFMSELAVNHDLWQQWKGQMPIIYNNQPEV